MGGLCGCIHYVDRNYVDQPGHAETATQMVDAAADRGPDDIKTGLGPHNSLACIALTLTPADEHGPRRSLSR